MGEQRALLYHAESDCYVHAVGKEAVERAWARNDGLLADVTGDTSHEARYRKQQRRELIDDFHGEYRFLSNFYYSPIHVLGFTMPTVEHAFQAAKSLDPEFHRGLSRDPDPGYAKYLGRGCDLRPDWERIKLGVMAHCLRLKFTPGSLLSEKLLKTGSAVLEEANEWRDDFWGTYRGTGQNWLGRLLMQVRGEIGGPPVDEGEMFFLYGGEKR